MILRLDVWELVSSVQTLKKRYTKSTFSQRCGGCDSVGQADRLFLPADAFLAGSTAIIPGEETSGREAGEESGMVNSNVACKYQKIFVSNLNAARRLSRKNSSKFEYFV